MGLFNFLKSNCSVKDSEILKTSVDRHSHILYGVDDGIKTLEDSLEVLEYEESLGVKEVWCTPHIMEDVPNTSEFLNQRFAELCEAYKGPLKLHLAAEYMIDTLFEERLEKGDLLLMEDDLVLMETSTVVPPYDLKAVLSATLSSGYRPLFAHPERCRFLELKDIEELHDMGVYLQLNLPSLTGFYGRAVKQKAEALLKKGRYYAYGSDCHRLNVLKHQYTVIEVRKDMLKHLSGILQ